MRWQSRSHAVCKTWPAVGLLTALGPAGVKAQEVVDLPAEDLPLAVDLEAVYRIGSAVARSEWEEFTAVRHIGFDGEGNLYILDAPGPEAGTRVVIVDPQGRHVKDFGRQGEGPGEFRWPRRMVVWADGSTLIEDVLHMGSHVFGPEGDFEHMVRGGVGPSLRPDPVDGNAVVGVSWRREDENRRAVIRFDVSSGEVREQTLVEAWVPQKGDEGGEAPATLEEFVGEVWGFEPALLFDVLPSGGIAFADSTAYAVKLTDRAGMVTRILRRPIPPLPATEAMKRAERERRLDWHARNPRTESGGGEPTAEMEALTAALDAAQSGRGRKHAVLPRSPGHRVGARHMGWHALDPEEHGTGRRRAGGHRRDLGGRSLHRHLPTRKPEHAACLRAGWPGRVRRNGRTGRSGHHGGATTGRGAVSGGGSCGRTNLPAGTRTGACCLEGGG